MRTFDEMHRAIDEMDRAFEQLRTAWWTGGTPALGAGPATDDGRLTIDARQPTSGLADGFDGEFGRDAALYLEDEGDEYVFAMDLPGFEREDIDCTFEGGVLSIRAHTEVEEGTDALRTMRSRRVARQVPVPKEVVVEEITAAYRNGVLEVHLPIVEGEREASGHRIDVE